MSAMVTITGLPIEAWRIVDEPLWERVQRRLAESAHLNRFAEARAVHPTGIFSNLNLEFSVEKLIALPRAAC